jgi:hypothetical protein
MRESPTRRPQIASSQIHISNNEDGTGQRSAFWGIHGQKHNEGTLKNDMEGQEERWMKDGERRSTRTNLEGGQFRVGTNSVADDRVGFSGIHAKENSQTDGYYSALLPTDMQPTIERFSSPMPRFDISGPVESESRKDLKRAIASQHSIPGEHSIRIQLNSSMIELSRITI